MTTPRRRRAPRLRAAARATKRPAPPPRDGERKRDATRRLVLARALELFQHHGVDATTMRDIAAAAGLSLGAAYYHFPSKEALVFAFYDDNQAELEALADRTTGPLRDRLGAVLHGQLHAIAPRRAMLTSIIPRLVDPGDPLSAFSQRSRAVRERSIGVLARMLGDAGLPPDACSVAAHALWLLELAAMLVFVHDDSPGGTRTHGLVDDGLDMLVPLLPLLGTPPGRALCERVTRSLARAGIQIAAAHP